MKTVLALLALAAIFTVPAHAQDEAPGSQSQIVAAIPAGGFSCGRASYPLYCYGIPANIGRTFWLDSYWQAGNGFIAFNGVADLGQATITSSQVTSRNASNEVTGLTVQFHGSTNAGDGGTYIGSGTFTFSYYHCTSRYCGDVMVLQSGSMTITYN